MIDSTRLALARGARRWVCVAAWLGMSATAPAIADAQGPYQQEVVVTAAAVPVELGTTTRAITVLTRRDIEQLPVNSIADVLRLASAVDVRARGERGMQTDFSVRGAGFGQALVLVDGIRLNDAQSGHHNGDIPVPLDAVERIEILQGLGSSILGADAFGGTINVITRRESPASASIEAGSFGYVSARGQATLGRLTLAPTLLSVAAGRSDGFAAERQYATVDLLARTSLGERSAVTISHLWKDFGASGFYGTIAPGVPAPSHEWTNQTRLAAEGGLGTVAGWQVSGAASYRTHGDHFLFNVERPGVAENWHRSHAAIGSIKATRTTAAGAVTAGLEAGGDWIRSTNLGDHATSRVSAFGEWRQALDRRTLLDASLRVDRYDEFGVAANPGIGIGWWMSDTVRLRASTGRAFRVPTFTERYYSDPANLARAEVGPETAWGGEGGIDVFGGTAWLIQGTVFARRDRDVIDWLRPTVTDRWRTFNVHHVRTTGIELSIRRSFGSRGSVQAGYSATSLDPSTLSTLCGAPTCLSKYVLEYAPHVLTAAAVLPLRGGLHLAPRFEYKHRRRNATSSDYGLLDVRLSRAFGRYELRVEGTNLGDADYEEIAGVAMPGRAATVTFAICLSALP